MSHTTASSVATLARSHAGLAAISGDLERAVRLLEEAGCTAVYLFGSFADGTADEHSDIDLAVEGCPPGRFFALLGRLLREVQRPLDLVDLDASTDPFVQRLRHGGELVRLG